MMAEESPFGSHGSGLQLCQCQIERLPNIQTGGMISQLFYFLEIYLNILLLSSIPYLLIRSVTDQSLHHLLLSKLISHIVNMSSTLAEEGTAFNVIVYRQSGELQINGLMPHKMAEESPSCGSHGSGLQLRQCQIERLPNIQTGVNDQIISLHSTIYLDIFSISSFSFEF